jgi:phosphoribosylformylglycinamidine synthase II
VGYFVQRKVPFPLSDINLREATDTDLLRINAELKTGLSLDELRQVRRHFEDEGRNPTDVELQAVGQAWSEHCCYKSSKLILKEHFSGLDTPDVLAKEDAGVMAFTDDWAYALRIESHNHPSALDPYGGAATGIGGILRDVLCMGAQPIALVDPLFFGPLDTPDDRLPKGAKHPSYLFRGVVAGIRDYGNRVGIPTVAGGVRFHEGYTGNCLVNVGCLGIVRRDRIVHSALGAVGDLLVLVGGRTGRDGIHGVTFASGVLREKSDQEDRGAVQLGDPITKEPLMHAVLEAADKGLLTGMKDLGGGGLSCVCGELALAAGLGAVVRLDAVPLKETGLAPWEVWVSESQERMMLCVAREQLDRVLDIFQDWDVEASVIGEAVPGDRITVTYRGVVVADLDLEWYTGGPVYKRPQKAWRKTGKEVRPQAPKTLDERNGLVLRMLSDPNICSREWVVRQYDFDVRARTVVKPFTGVPFKEGPADAVVLKPLEDDAHALALGIGMAPEASALDPYRGGKLVLDEVVRNLAAVGASPHSITNCLNFGNPERPERMWEFAEVVRGMAEACRALRIPVPSGNVSFYNEAEGTAVPPTATVFGVGVLPFVRRAVTPDLKRKGDLLYLVGATKPDMGGSSYYRLAGGEGGQVPDVSTAQLRLAAENMAAAAHSRLMRAAHDVADGGLAVTLAEMAIGGDIGLTVGADAASPRLPWDSALFSESPTRWVVEVDKKRADDFEEAMAPVPLRKIGEVGGGSIVVQKGAGDLIEIAVREARKAWSEPLWRAMG